MATVRWQGNVSNAWAAGGNWIGAAIPVHGDDVQFLGADLGANRCAVGPTAVVLLNSITADAAYDVGVGATVCYANCGMDGRPIATVDINGDSHITGGWVTTLTLDGDSAEMSGGTVTTATLTGTGNTCRISGGTITTANLNGATNRVSGGTITTLNMNGATTEVTAAVTVTTCNMDGAGCHLDIGTFTTVYMNDDTCEFRAAPVATTLYVYGATCDVSLTAIAAGLITNGPYVCGLDQILYDYDTGEVIADLSQIPSYSAGRW